MNVTRRHVLQAGIVTSVALSSSFAFAQEYPSRAIRLVVIFPPGGSVDVVARMIAEPMSQTLGQPIIIENIAGAGGNIGAAQVARSDPDGYTILAGLNSLFAFNPHLYANMPFDPMKDFTPITQTVASGLLLMVNPKFPAKNLAEFLAYAKANPGKVTFSSNGNGSAGHITGEMLQRAADVKMLHVAYRGAAQALNDVIAGHIDATFDPLSTAVAQVQSNTLRPIATASLKRSAVLPDVPTISETFAGFDTSGWQGFFVRAGTPPDIVAKLHAAAADALKRPAVVKRIREFAFEPIGSRPEEFLTLVRNDHDKWGKVIREAGIRLAE